MVANYWLVVDFLVWGEFGRWLRGRVLGFRLLRWHRLGGRRTVNRRLFRVDVMSTVVVAVMRRDSLGMKRSASRQGCEYYT